MGKPRNIHKYHFRKGNNIVHRGITDDLQRREQEHQQTYRGGHIVKIGRRTTREAAEEWEREGGRGN
jgi:predicted GIY-YIG superfamily endonuclease